MPDLNEISDQLEAAVDALAQVDPTSLGDGESVVFLHRQLARLDAVTTRADAAFDARGEWETEAARSAASWIAARCRLPIPTARRRVRLGRALRHMPRVEATW